MKINKKCLILAVFGGVLAGVNPVFAADNDFTAHHLVPAEPYAQKARQLPGEEKLELREYLKYQQREPCQGYRPVPQPFVEDGCGLKAKLLKAPPLVIEETQTQTTIPGLRPIIAEYKLYFDFDRYNIRDSEQPTLTKISEEIKKYQPFEVTIAGYTDRSGTDDYNYDLSRKRAEAVSWALTNLGIPNRVLGQEAHGETNPAVPTPDGVKLEENRRVEVQFRK
jgi:outer membrane protein OmpA-like peptidoglycan-associated protein